MRKNAKLENKIRKALKDQPGDILLPKYARYQNSTDEEQEFYFMVVEQLLENVLKDYKISPVELDAAIRDVRDWWGDWDD